MAQTSENNFGAALIEGAKVGALVGLGIAAIALMGVPAVVMESVAVTALYVAAIGAAISGAGFLMKKAFAPKSK